MDSNLRSVEFDRILELVSLEARTSLGREAVAARRPLSDLPACERAQSELAEMVRFYLQEGLLPMGGLTDVRPLLSSDRLFELAGSWQVIRSARATQALRESLTRTADSYPLLARIASGITDLSDLLRTVGRYFTAEGKLRAEASATLTSLRSRIQTKRRSVQQTLQELMSRHQGAMQEPLITIRAERYCIPLRADHRGAIPGILHERSGSGSTLFIEPLDVVEANNDLADLMMQEREEILRITKYIAEELIDSAEDLIGSVLTAGQLDAIQACALFSRMTESNRPQFSETGELSIVQGRHPLLDERLLGSRREAFAEDGEGGTVVPVSFALDSEKRALIISGPNAGGKTVALKTAGLLTAMAISGLQVPAAEGTVIPIVDQLHVLIGDEQNVLEHLSTFSGYLARLRRVLERATPRSLVLLDELGSGTDPEEGSALAAAAIDFLLDVGCPMIITTHLSALKTFALSDARIRNASMEFDAVSGRSTFRVIVGVPGRSRAIDVAEAMGLPSKVIESSRERLGDRYGEMDRLIAELHSTLAEATAQREEGTRLRQAAEHELEALRRQHEEVVGEKKRLAKSYRSEMEELKREVSRRLAREIKGLRIAASTSRTEAERVFDTIVEPITDRRELQPESGAVAVGDRAQHRAFRIVGTVVSIEGEKAVLDAGGKKVTLATSELRPADPAPDRLEPATVRKQREERSTLSEPQISAELNLIGTRVEEAIDESDRFLDRSLLEGRGAVRLIHGFGTGALRSAIREHLRNHPAVRSFRRGDEREGGDGATIVVLDR